MTDFNKAVEQAYGSGVLWLGFKGFSTSDFQKILEALSKACEEDEEDNGREFRFRKCRRLEGVPALVSKLSTLRGSQAKKIWKFNVVGNTSIGDAGMQHLHLLPLSIRDLDLSNCNLKAEGLKNVIEFMRVNQTITRLVMWGNESEKVDGVDWEHLLSDNNTLEDLCIRPDSDTIFPLLACFGIGRGIRKNKKLRHLSMAYPHEYKRDNNYNAVALALSCKLNKHLEHIEFGCPRDETTLHFWEDTLKTNETLKFIDVAFGGFGGSDQMKHYLDLNALNARQLFKGARDGQDINDEDERRRQKLWESKVLQAVGRTSSHDNYCGMKGFYALYYLLRSEPGFLTAFWNQK